MENPPPPPQDPRRGTDGGPPEPPDDPARAGRRPVATIVTVVILAVVLVAALIVALLLGRDADSAPPTEESRNGQDVTGEGPTEEGPAADDADGDVAIFLCDGKTCPRITDAQEASLLAHLGDDDRVGAVVYESSADAYERFLEMFADQPHITETIDEETLPPAFRVWLHDPGEAEDLAASLADQPGVDEVTVVADLPSARADGAPPDAEVGTLRDAIEGVAAMTIELCDGTRCPEISDAERAAIEAALDEHPLVARTRHRTKEQNYEVLVETFGEEEGLLEHVTPDLVPETIEIWVVDQQAWFDDPALFDELAEDLRVLPGVETSFDRMHDLRELHQP